MPSMYSIPTSSELSGTVLPMFPADGGGSAQLSQTETHASKPRPLNPRSSLNDYNRVMLEYTRRRLSTFAEADGPPPRHTSASRTRSNTRENNSTTSTTDPDSSTVAARGDAVRRAARDSSRS
ncbi:hypothetical protein PHISP_04300 [Aspergillus sp. HF37]|nr:hypothetical protein PHISP_04300 [Aspergillus sp. HF37]